MVSKELGHFPDDSNQVLFHLLVPDDLQVGVMTVLQSILGNLRVF